MPANVSKYSLFNMRKIMRKIFILALIFFIFSLIVDKTIAEGVSQNKSTNSISVSNDNIDLILHGLSRNFFDVKINQDTIFIKRIGYYGIEKLQIQFLNGEPDSHFLKGVIIYGVNQSLTDDFPQNIPLDFSFKDTIQINKINDRYIPFTVIKNDKYLTDIFEKIYFQEIKQESYTFQKLFYQKNIIDSLKQWECCPEYIEQAKTFLSRKKVFFKTLSDLALETDYKKIILKLDTNKYLVYDNIGDFGFDGVKDYYRAKK